LWEIQAPPPALSGSPLQKGGKPLKSKASCFLIFRPLFEGGSLKGWGICLNVEEEGCCRCEVVGLFCCGGVVEFGNLKKRIERIL
jgi:hypothetical protein